MSASQTIPIDRAQADALAVQAGADSTQITQFESESLSLNSEALSIVITDQTTYEQAVDCGNRIAGAQKRWADWIKHPYEVVYGAYKTILGTKKAVEDPLEGGKKYVARQIQQWDYQQEQARLTKQRELEDKQRREEEERRLSAAAAAETAGLAPAAVEQILAEPSTAPTPVAAPTYQKASGVSVRKNWGGEVTDLMLVIKAAAKGNKNAIAVLEINQPALNAQARTHEAALATVIPGTRGVDKGSTAFRAGR